MIRQIIGAPLGEAMPGLSRAAQTAFDALLKAGATHADGPEFAAIHPQLARNISAAKAMVGDLAGMGLVRWLDGVGVDARIALGAS